MSSPRSSTTWSSTDSSVTVTSLSKAQAFKLNDKFSRPTLPPSLPSQALSQEWKRESGFWRSFLAICIPLLLSALEGSVTNTALPTISNALDLGTTFSWVATAFLFAGTIFQPLYSQLGDMWGRKCPMMVAVTVFAIGSAICGAANSGAVLIFGRIIQGLGTGGIDLFAEMILCDIIPLRKRGPYLAIKHVTFAVGTTLGPLLGGVFAEHGWRWCFLSNIPVCGVSLVVIWLYLNVGGGARANDVAIFEELKKIDYVGSCILTASLIMLLVALSTGGVQEPWSHPGIVLLVMFGSMSLVAFICWERSDYCKHPVMPPEVFSNRTTNIAFTLTTIHGFITYGYQFYLPPYFQAVQGSSPTKSGLQVMPTTLVIVVLAAIGGPLLSFWGKYKPMHITGFALMTLGLGLCITLDSQTPIEGWLCFQLTAASGFGIVISTMLPAVQVKLSESTTGASAGSWAFLRGAGSLFGVAIPGAVFNVRFAQLLPSISSPAARAKLTHGKAYSRASATFIRSFGPKIQLEIVNAFAAALKSVWIVFAVLAAAGFLLTWWEKEYKMREDLNTRFGLRKKCDGTEGTGTGETTAVPSGAATPALSCADLQHVESECC